MFIDINSLSICVFILLHLEYVFTQSHMYKAAVLEYSPKFSGHTPAENILQNTKEYQNYIINAKHQGVDIIVFPEDGLTGMDVDGNSLELVSTRVPDPSENISPCIRSQHGNYSKFFVDLSCSIRTHRIYAVVNLVEWKHKDIGSNNKIYYNTNVAFDRSGTVIARYRKINLYDEPDYEPGEKHQVSTFETDFGVKFGMFTCFDILFKYPAQNILSDFTVTDIAYPTAWYSEIPFFESLSVQHGYSKSNGVNLLAAGTNDPGATNGGSGIYLHNGRIEQTYVSGRKSSRLIIKSVPKIRSRKDSSNTCQAASDFPRDTFGDHYAETEFFRTKQSDLRFYTFKPVNLNEKEVSETICSKGSDFCCSFNITIDKTRNVLPNYAYKLAAFYGVTQVTETKRLGLRNCGLIACLNESDSSCGERQPQPPTGVTFKSISVKGNFDVRDSHQRPATLNFDMTPSTDYMYCTKTSEGNIEISLSTSKPQHSLLTFGIVGRAFQYDDTPVRLISGANADVINVYLAFCLSIFVFLQLE